MIEATNAANAGRLSPHDHWIGAIDMASPTVRELANCANCQAFFRPKKTFQVYCSPTCRKRASTVRLHEQPRICACCRETKPRSDFHSKPIVTRWGTRTVAYVSTCQACFAAGNRERVIKRRKQCVACHRWRDVVHFYRHKYVTKTGGNSTRFESRCKACKSQAKRRLATQRSKHKAFSTNHHRAHPEKHWRYDLKATHGLTPEAYDRMVNEQGGRCAICQETPAIVRPFRHALKVDHCHTSKRIRGLLCHHCNVALGHLKEDPVRIHNLLAYLAKHTDVEATCRNM